MPDSPRESHKRRPVKIRPHGLTSKGYFPSELPPTFSTTDFGTHVVEILSEWNALEFYKTVGAGKVPHSKRTKQGAYCYKITAAEPELISKPKRRYERRNINLVHPVSQALLCDEISNKWHSIQKWQCKKLCSLNRIEIGRNYVRRIKGINFELHRAKKDYIEAISDWLVATDISPFYPSIYTHSIARRSEVEQHVSLG